MYDYSESMYSRYRSDIGDYALTSDATLRLGAAHTLRAGLKVSLQSLNPLTEVSSLLYSRLYQFAVNTTPQDEAELEKKRPKFKTLTDTTAMRIGQRQNVLMAAAYAEDDYSVTHWLRANYGLRLALYSVTGKSYLSLEPRLSLRILLGRNVALKASYSRMAQALHRLVSSNMVMASDIWVPVTKDVPLMTSNLYAAGVSCRLPLGLEAEVEGYYKTMNNVLDYLNGASYLVGNTDWFRSTGLGRGRGYGVELMLSRRVGATTGWLSYTWSKSLRTFDRPGQEIDAGHEFYAATDRRHNLSVNLSHVFRLTRNSRLGLTASWTYLSGRRGTVATTTIFTAEVQEFGASDVASIIVNGYRGTDYQISFEPTKVFYTRFGTYGMPQYPAYTYRNRNNYQLPATHHLDVNVEYTYAWRLGESSVALGVYNVYNRMNVSSVFVGYSHNKMALKGICPFPIMPSITLTHKF